MSAQNSEVKTEEKKVDTTEQVGATAGNSEFASALNERRHTEVNYEFSKGDKGYPTAQVKMPTERKIKFDEKAMNQLGMTEQDVLDLKNDILKKKEKLAAESGKETGKTTGSAFSQTKIDYDMTLDKVDGKWVAGIRLKAPTLAEKKVNKKVLDKISNVNE